MCGTENDENAQSCKYCGYIFENFSTSGIDTQPVQASQTQPFPAPQPQEKAPPTYMTPSMNPVPSYTSPMSSIASSATPATSTGAPLFVVSRSLLTSIAPSLIYLAVVALIGLATLSLYAIGYLAFFFLIAFVPSLFAPRKYEFYDTSLKLHKTIGGDSEIPYSQMTLYDSRTGRRPRILLSIEGQRRPMAIPGNPKNNELGQDLNQFLQTKVKKFNPEPTTEENSEQKDTLNTTSSSDSTQ